MPTNHPILVLALLTILLSDRCSCTVPHQCDIESLTATEPHRAMQDEAGLTEIWDFRTPEFLCSGVVAARLTVHPGGLVLPSYNSAPFLSFVLKGSGVHGVVVPGCRPDSSQSEPGDHSQRLFRSREGDVVSSVAGFVQWIYNDGDRDFVTINLFDSKSVHNQLDRKVRSFFMAGKSQQSREYGKINGGNIFSGINEELLKQVFPGVDHETIHKIQAETDERGSIVLAPDLHFRVPEDDEEHEKEKEKSFCNLKFKYNLDNGANRTKIADGETLPILRFLWLSAAHGVLRKNAIIGPEWMVNAHRAVYVTSGEGRFEVVNDEGNAVFDGVVKRGRILVIPQGFAVVVKARGEGFEWVEMRTHENALSSSVVGRKSVLGAIPTAVLAKAFDVSREQAMRLKGGGRGIGIKVASRGSREGNDVV